MSVSIICSDADADANGLQFFIVNYNGTRKLLKYESKKSLKMYVDVKIRNKKRTKFIHQKWLCTNHWICSATEKIQSMCVFIGWDISVIHHLKFPLKQNEHFIGEHNVIANLQSKFKYVHFNIHQSFFKNQLKHYQKFTIFFRSIFSSPFSFGYCKFNAEPNVVLIVSNFDDNGFAAQVKDYKRIIL